MNRTTPRPWKIEDSTHIVQAVGNAAGVVVCDVENYSRFTQDDARNAANAELIVRAVNAHDDLVAACKAALQLAWEVGSESEDGVGTLLADGRGDLWRQLTAAVTKAEGQ